MLGSITTEQVYLELTFLTLAMLVVGGVTSLWGAVVGALAVSGLDSLLGNAEDGIGVGFTLDLPEGSRLVILGALMALMLILRPSGITGGRELRLRDGGRREGLHRRLRRRGIAVRGQPRARSTTSRSGRTTSREAHVDAINERGLRLTGAGEVHATGIRATARRRRAAGRATSGSSRRRRCTPRRRSPRPRTPSRAARVASVQNGVGNEEAIAPHVARVIRGTTFPAGKILEPGVVQWDVKGDTTFGPFEPSPATADGDRAARGCVHARRACRRTRSPTRAARSGGR